MGERLERYLPAEERRTALWLAWVVAVLEVLRFLPDISWGYWAQRHPVRSAALHALVYVVLVALALWRARARVGAPRIVVGGTLVFAGAGTISHLLTVLTLAAYKLAGAPFPVPLRQTVAQQVLAQAGSVAVVAFGLLGLFVHALLSQGEEEGDSLDVSGLGPASDPLGRRLVVGGALLMLAYAVLLTSAVAVLTVIVYSRVSPTEFLTTNPRAAIASAAIAPVAAFLAALLVLRRRGTPRAVWLTVSAMLVVRAVAGVARMLPYAFPVSAGEIPQLAAMLGDMLLMPLLITAAMLFAVRLASSRRPTPPSAEEVASAA